jgi:hypothetical protein
LFVWRLPFQSRCRSPPPPSILSFHPSASPALVVMWITIVHFRVVVWRAVNSCCSIYLYFVSFTFFFFLSCIWCVCLIGNSPKRPEQRRVTKLKRRKAYYRHKKDVSPHFTLLSPILHFRFWSAGGQTVNSCHTFDVFFTSVALIPWIWIPTRTLGMIGLARYVRTNVFPIELQTASNSQLEASILMSYFTLKEGGKNLHTF